MAFTMICPVASAQVKSSLLLAGLYAQGITTVIEPAPTRDHTERMLAGFGYKVNIKQLSEAQREISLQGGGTLKGGAIDVPSGYLIGGVFLVAAASIVPGSDLTLEHNRYQPYAHRHYKYLTADGCRH